MNFNRVFHYFHHPFWGGVPLFLETSISSLWVENTWVIGWWMLILTKPPLASQGQVLRRKNSGDTCSCDDKCHYLYQSHGWYKCTVPKDGCPNGRLTYRKKKRSPASFKYGFFCIDLGGSPNMILIWIIMKLQPPKTNIEPKNWWFVDVFLSKWVFSGSMLVFWGVIASDCYRWANWLPKASCKDPWDYSNLVASGILLQEGILGTSLSIKHNPVMLQWYQWHCLICKYSGHIESYHDLCSTWIYILILQYCMLL